MDWRTLLEWLGAILVVPGLIGLNAFFVAAEYSLVAIRPTQIAKLLEEKRVGAAALASLRADLSGAIALIQICITLTNLVLGSVVEPMVAGAIEGGFRAVLGESGLSARSVDVSGTVVAFLLVTLLTVIFGELLPKAVTLQNTTTMALWIAEPMRLLRIPLRPLVWLMSAFGNLVMRLCGLGRVRIEESVHSADELEMLVDQAHEAGELHSEQGKMLQRVFDLTDRKVAEMVIPHERLIALHLGMTREELSDLVAGEPHTRWPVLEAPGGRIAGIAGAKHVLYLLTMGDVLTLSDVTSPIPEVHENMTLIDALRLLRKAQRHMAVVRAPDGRQLGIVTLEDLLSAVVGELPTEPAVVSEQPAAPPSSDSQSLQARPETPGDSRAGGPSAATRSEP